MDRLDDLDGRTGLTRHTRRGPIEACRGPCGARPHCCLPRHTRRGPIEASPRSPTFLRPETVFHATPGVAPLKHPRYVLTGRHGRPVFHATPGVAPLKRDPGRT